MAGVLAHGGAVGAAFEIGFILIPVVIFFFLARWSKRKAEQEEDEEGSEDETPAEAGETDRAGVAEDAQLDDDKA